MTDLRDDWDLDERDALAGLSDELEAIRRRHGADPPLELLRAARAEALPDDLQAEVARHLSTSAWSRALVEGASSEAALTAGDRERLLARILTEARRQETTRTWKWLRPAILGPALLAAASVAWLVWSGGGVPAPTEAPEATVAVAQPPPAPAPFLLGFDKPEVRLSLAALTWRGSTGDNPLLADLKPALDAYRRDDYDAARRELSVLGVRYPGAIEIPFYQGISSLFLNDLPGAITALSAAEKIGDPTFADEISWYRAVAEQRAGNVTGARQRLDALCRGNGRSRTRACEALEQLTDRAASPR